MMKSTPKPHVIINMAMSADGKISTRRRERITLGSKHDRQLMDVLRACVDAVIIGAGTLKIDGYPLLVRDAKIRHKRIERGLPLHPVNVILSRKLEIPTRRPFFEHEETQKILFTTHAAGMRKRKRFEKYAEVVTVPLRPSFLQYVLSNLAGRGLKRILVEGGGEVNFSFFREALVDELYLTVTPRIIGGTGTPSVVDGKGFLKDTHVKLDLMSSKRIGQEVFLRYRVRNSR